MAMMTQQVLQQRTPARQALRAIDHDHDLAVNQIMQDCADALNAETDAWMARRAPVVAKTVRDDTMPPRAARW